MVGVNYRLFALAVRLSCIFADNRVLTCGYRLSILTLMSDWSETITKQKRQQKRYKFYVLFGLCLPVLIFSLASCKTAVKKPAAHKQKAEDVPMMKRGRILADAKDDIAIIESVQDDWRVLQPAMAGKALDTLKAEIEGLKADGLVKVREYEKLELEFGSLKKGVAGVTVQFLDNSEIVRLETGQSVVVSRAERKKFYIGLAKVEGRWKIISLLTGIKEDKKNEH